MTFRFPPQITVTRWLDPSNPGHRLYGLNPPGPWTDVVVVSTGGLPTWDALIGFMVAPAGELSFKGAKFLHGLTRTYRDTIIAWPDLLNVTRQIDPGETPDRHWADFEIPLKSYRLRELGYGRVTIRDGQGSYQPEEPKVAFGVVRNGCSAQLYTNFCLPDPGSPAAAELAQAVAEACSRLITSDSFQGIQIGQFGIGINCGKCYDQIIWEEVYLRTRWAVNNTMGLYTGYSNRLFTPPSAP